MTINEINQQLAICEAAPAESFEFQCNYQPNRAWVHVARTGYPEALKELAEAKATIERLKAQLLEALSEEGVSAEQQREVGL